MAEKIVIDLTTNELDVDWFRGLRLLEEGTEESLKKLKKMDNTKMVSPGKKLD